MRARSPGAASHSLDGLEPSRGDRAGQRERLPCGDGNDGPVAGDVAVPRRRRGPVGEPCDRPESRPYRPGGAVDCGGLADRRALDLEAHAAVDHDIDPRVPGCYHLEVRDVASPLRSPSVILRFPLVLVAHRRLADDERLGADPSMMVAAEQLVPADDAVPDVGLDVPVPPY